ncbi:hypothetical protein N9582_06250, partial [Amylibacter sp.]|nr:hypothetical protein [Amylibacter sp.]
MFLYKGLITLLIVIFLFKNLVQKKYNYFEVTIFLAAFTAVKFDAGVSISIFHISLLFFFCLPNIRINLKNNSINTFIIYSIVNTIIMSIFFIDDYVEVGGYFRSEGRFISQILLFALNFSIIFIAYRYIKTLESAHKALKVILESMVLLALLGWLQFTTYQLFNIDIF